MEIILKFINPKCISVASIDNYKQEKRNLVTVMIKIYAKI